MKRSQQSLLIALFAVALQVQKNDAECQLCDHHLIASSTENPIQNISGQCILQEPHETTGFLECCPKRDTKCDDGEEEEGRKCRYIDSFGEYCDPTKDANQCDSLEEMETKLVLNIDFKEITSPEGCCLSCQCYGDPNCVSFDGKTDAWVLCDARELIPGSDKWCDITENMCNTQVDPNGNPCVWLNKKNKKWPVALFGSPCQPDWNAGPLPVMTMYKADTFQLDLVMGERGIIGQAIMRMGDTTYTLDALRCDNYGAGPQSQLAWTVETAEGGENGAIPRNFHAVKTNPVETTWFTRDVMTGIEVKFTCTKSSVGNVFGPPRINVQELLEPETNYRRRRKGVAGSCAVGKILDKTGSTANTDAVHLKCVENAQSDTLLFSKAVCLASISTPQIGTCLEDWCSSTAGSRENCVHHIERDTRDTFCRAVAAANQVPPDTEEHTRYVNRCKTTIAEFDWKAAVQEFGDGRESGGQVSDPLPCINSEDALPLELGSCDTGITVMYLEAGEWKPAFGIPSSQGLCDGTIEITPGRFPKLFTHPIRFQQCEPETMCQSTASGSSVEHPSCSTIQGVDVSFRFTDRFLEPTHQLTLDNLECVPNPRFKGKLEKTWCFDIENIESLGPKVCPCGQPPPICGN